MNPSQGSPQGLNQETAKILEDMKIGVKIRLSASDCLAGMELVKKG
jgi:hypothetical protein